MSEILIRICVGVCGFLTVVAAMNAMRGSKSPWIDSLCAAAASTAGLTAILRALGVL